MALVRTSLMVVSLVFVASIKTIVFEVFLDLTSSAFNGCRVLAQLIGKR